MQVIFTRWCLDPKGRTSVSVDPTRVECTEHYVDAFDHSGTDEKFPAATNIIMRNSEEYTVQGSLDEVVRRLNVAEANHPRSTGGGT